MRVLCIRNDLREYGAFIIAGSVYHVAEEVTCKKCGQGYFGLEEIPREKFDNITGPWRPIPLCHCGGKLPVPDHIMWRKEYFRPLDGGLGVTEQEVKELFQPKESVYG